MGLEALAANRAIEIEEALRKAEEADDRELALKILLNAINSVRDEVSDISVEEVSVNNLDEIKAHLRNELTRALRPVIGAVSDIVIPEVKIPEFPEIPKPLPFPESIKVDNFPDQKEVDLGGVLAGFEQVLGQLEAIAGKEIKAPDVQVNVPETQVPDVNVDLGPLLEGINSLKTRLDPLKLLSRKANQPIAVRMSDGQKFIKELKKVADGIQNQVTAFSGGGITELQFKKAVRATNDPLIEYKVNDRDTSSTSPRYTGYTTKAGAWYVLRETRSTGTLTVRYAAGASDYTTNWTNRASLTYDYFYNTF